MTFDLYEAVADAFADSGELVGDYSAAEIKAAIGATASGSPSDSFWAAWDLEIGRLMDFFISVKDDPEVQRRMREARK